MTEDQKLTAFDVDLETRAAAVGLRYVSDEQPGYQRRRCGRGFSYRDWKGRTVRARRLRSRFATLAVPPAWTAVWICRHANGHLQATGQDGEGRKQYLYHERWGKVRDQIKRERLVAFATSLPRIRRRVARDLRNEGLTRDKVLAAVVRLLETSRARVGNDRYARDNGSYGLTTVRKRHVEGDEDSGFVLEFEGKGGKPWAIEVDDPKLVEVVAGCLEVPGYELFKYFDAEGVKRDVTSNDVNEYLREAAGVPVTAKDFRTWAGAVLAAVAGREQSAETADEDRTELRCVERVAEQLGNTPAVCREAYIPPEILAGLRSGELVDHLERYQGRAGGGGNGLNRSERAVLSFLERCGEIAPPPPG